ncbi:MULTISPECIES: LysR family transcriptional regulator [unclassified Janthinobacterium]|uniref:LysR family transcriptional regulator n=1 Tax=unclassified Janthinobacterium TaxID=2610881 RepID=UPI00161A515B|nr:MULTISPECIES: LysR family transcriptional regulator [unclassified Janthinobacterium]MBB5369959.1 DNA-binding transcriptional LysR family regulator [Janthinobacterium sp. K2C7]MBB5382765.1 DNA-binding transcriptional LysR family regulator [Janthinobacterium sp. K2Li3]MBB5384750.1 DNA-binding transcriptional LysR family regulator [Janthinobacterium sp. K2E3]
MKTDTAPDLAFFVLLAKLSSMTATARELGVTPPAVTKRLNLMEQKLGVRLVNRTTRRISLTNEGELYLAQATQILHQIREMEESISSGRAEPKGLLRINATPGFGRTRIAPILSRFAHVHPEVEVELHLTDRPISLVEEAYDLAIRFGELPDTRLTARKLMSNRRFLCASPAYLKKYGEPQTPAELQRHRCILHRQNDDVYGTWRIQKGKADELVKVRGAVSSNDGDVVMNWALEGHGIVQRSEWDAAKYLASGRLKEVMKSYCLPDADLYLYYLSRSNLPAKMRAFIDFIAQEFR